MTTNKPSVHRGRGFKGIVIIFNTIIKNYTLNRKYVRCEKSKCV